jgi:glycogen debranching enzyme
MLTGTVALKEDELQFISNEAGDVPADNPGGLGLYFRDTRFLNRFELSVNGYKPLFLSNSANKHYIATFQCINPLSYFQMESESSDKRSVFGVAGSSLGKDCTNVSAS